jgi:hypothetical protein
MGMRKATGYVLAALGWFVACLVSLVFVPNPTMWVAVGYIVMIALPTSVLLASGIDAA